MDYQGGKLANGNESPPRDSVPSGQFREIWSFLKTILIVVILALLVRVSFIEAYKIPSGSMIPTLQIGDYILVNKLSYGLRIPKHFRMPQGFELPWEDGFLARYAEPRRGDIVVFTRPDDPLSTEDESRTNLIKRVIGVPGDKVEVRAMKVYVNGVPLEESYARWINGGPIEGNFGPEEVPPDHIFLLGDNRDNSRDSRFWSYPFISIERVKGKAFIIYWSLYDWQRMGNIVK